MVDGLGTPSRPLLEHDPERGNRGSELVMLIAENRSAIT